MSIIAAGGAHRGSVRDFYPITIDQSLRFNDDDSAYLSRTGTAGDSRTWTLSFWMKPSNASTAQVIFGAGPNSSNLTRIDYRADKRFQIFNSASGVANGSLVFDPYKFRDPSAWYHFVFVVNTPASETDRYQFYVNGERLTGISSTSGENTYPSPSATTQVNTAVAHEIGRRIVSNSEYLDGYLAEVHFTDGNAYTADAFGELKSGIWVAKAPSVTYGTNGFHLDFANSADIGNDVSGENNDWTQNNFNASDVVLDSPTNNFCTLSPLELDYVTLSDGNLVVQETAGSWRSIRSTFMMPTGKWFWEFEATASGSNYFGGGISRVSESLANYVGESANGYGILAFNGNRYNVSATTYTSAFTVGDVIGVAFDADAGTLAYYKDGTSLGTAFTGLTSGDFFPAFTARSSTVKVNFGQQDFYGTDGSGTLPTGYLPLSTANLPDPDIDIDPAQGASPEDYFNTVLYTGNGTAIGSGGKAITGVGFQPDWVWIKERLGSASHGLYDVVRGVTKQLESDTVTNETTESEGLTAFGADGFTVGNLAQVNTNNDTYVAWNWKAGGTGVSNTDGTTTGAVTVSANQTAGFSIVKYVGQHSTGGACTIGHGLNAVPSMIIAKQTSGGDNDWPVYHASQGAGKFGKLNGSPAPVFVSDSTVWNNTTPTTSVFSVGSGNLANNNGQDYIAYVFAEVEGFSSFGSYVGNGSTDGPFVYTGFRPAFVMTKRAIGGTNQWIMVDTARSPQNVNDNILYANLSNAEVADETIDFDLLSNGFKLRSGVAGNNNTSGSTYIYMAFAENPFKYSNAR